MSNTFHFLKVVVSALWPLGIDMDFTFVYQHLEYYQ